MQSQASEMQFLQFQKLPEQLFLQRSSATQPVAPLSSQLPPGQWRNQLQRISPHFSVPTQSSFSHHGKHSPSNA
jgi:hypothetical protein